MSQKPKVMRAWAAVSPERFEQLQAWADELGLQFSQFNGLCLWIGARQVMRMAHPEEFFTTQQWAQVIAGAVQHLPEDQKAEWVSAIQQEAKQLIGADKDGTE